MFTSNRLIYRTVEHFSSEGMKNESARRNLKETAKVTLGKEKDIDSGLAEKELEFKNSMKELEKLRGYPPGFLDNFVLKYPEIPISELDELIQVNRNVVPDELDDLLSRFTFLTWDIVRNYLKTFPFESAKSYENSLVKNDPSLSVRYPEKGLSEISDSNNNKIEFNKESLHDQTLKIRKDLAVFQKWWVILNEKNPDLFEKLSKEYPDLNEKIEYVTEKVRVVNDFLQTLPESEFLNKVDFVLSYIEEYNEQIAYLNKALTTLNKFVKEKEANSEKGVDIAALTEDQKVELRNFAKDLYNEFFPPSYLDQAVLFYTGQKELEGYQKVLLSGGNGFEMAVKGAISLLDPDTYSDAFNNIATLFEMDLDDVEILLKSLPDLVAQLDSADSISAAITVIFSVIVFKGGIAKVTQFAKKMNYSGNILSIIKSIKSGASMTRVLGKVGKVTPLAMLSATTLPYIKVADSV